MNTEEAHNAVRSRFSDLIARPEDLPTQYPNVDGFDRPANRTWARLTFRAGSASQTQIGTPRKRFREPGTLIVQVFAPAGDGERAALSIADKTKKAFRSVHAGGVVYRTPTVIPVGRAGEWYQVNVDCPYYTEDTN